MLIVLKLIQKKKFNFGTGRKTVPELQKNKLPVPELTGIKLSVPEITALKLLVPELTFFCSGTKNFNAVISGTDSLTD